MSDRTVVPNEDDDTTNAGVSVHPSPARVSLFSIFPPSSCANDSFAGSPSLAPSAHEVVVRAPREMRFLLVALMVSIGVFTAFYYDAFGVVNQKLTLGVNLLILLGTIDYVQRVYVFRGDCVSRRILFRWFRYALPTLFTVHREMSGAIIIVDDQRDEVILSISRDMVDSKMTDALKGLYRCREESTFEIG